MPQGRARLWLALWLLLLLAPLGLLLVSPLPAKGGFGWNLGIAAGFVALAMLVLQFFLTARLRTFTRPFGIDLIYCFHRQIAWAFCLVLLLHPLPLLWLDGSLWRELSVAGRWELQSGALAFVLLLLLMLSSVWRKRLALAYQHWRRLHLLLALAAAVLALLHVRAVGYYSAVPALQVFWWLCLAAVLLLVLVVHVLRPALLLRRPWVVSEVKVEAGACTTLTLQPQGHAGLSFHPGQFAWLSLGHSPFSLAEHPFSLCSAPRADGGVQFTIKQLGDFTRSLPAVQPGTPAWVDGPYGVFSIDRFPDAPGYVFIGGGIGIAPLFSMLQALAARGDRRPHLLFAAHSRFDRIPRRDELVALAQQLHLRTIPVLEEPPEHWSGERGWISTELLRRHLGAGELGHHYFLCGPKPMTRLAERCLRELGVPWAQIHTELFDMA